MKKRILQIFLLAAAFLFSGSFLPCPCVFADTDGSEIIVVQPEKLEIQLGTDWIGAEFQLRTDQGLYPNLIPVGNDGVLRLEIGGSGSYILSCVSTGRTMPISRPEAYYTPAPLQSVPSSAPVYTPEYVAPAPESVVYPVSETTLPQDAEPEAGYSDEAAYDDDFYYEEPYDDEYYEYEDILIAGIPLKHALFFIIGLLTCISILVALQIASVRISEDDDFDDNDE